MIDTDIEISEQYEMENFRKQTDDSKKKTAWLIILIILTLVIPPVSAETSKPPSPFYPGEKLIFALRWGVIHAGEATLEILPFGTVSGEPAWHFVMTAKTNSFIDTFYKVRDQIDSYTDDGLTRSLLYKKKQREGKSKRDIAVTFDWESGKAHYVNKGKAKPPISLMPGTFDPLAAFYFSRMTDFKTDTVLRRPITDGKKNIMGRITVKKRETIKIGETSYDTFLLEPDLKDVSGVFEKSKDSKIHLWVTADERRIPVKIASKVIVGSFVGELVSATYGKSPEEGKEKK
ncbi:MAG: DUF3108 domain-containing protein [Desulfococcaceae bacterium]